MVEVPGRPRTFLTLETYSSEAILRRLGVRCFGRIVRASSRCDRSRKSASCRGGSQTRPYEKPTQSSSRQAFNTPRKSFGASQDFDSHFSSPLDSYPRVKIRWWLEAASPQPIHKTLEQHGHMTLFRDLSHFTKLKERQEFAVDHGVSFKPF